MCILVRPRRQPLPYAHGNMPFFICQVPSMVRAFVTFVVATAGARSAPSDQITDQHHRGLRTSQSHRMIYHHHARQGLALSRTLLRVR